MCAPIYCSFILNPIYCPLTLNPIYCPLTLHPIYCPLTLHPIYCPLTLNPAPSPTLRLLPDMVLWLTLVHGWLLVFLSPCDPPSKLTLKHPGNVSTHHHMIILCTQQHTSNFFSSSTFLSLVHVMASIML